MGRTGSLTCRVACLAVLCGSVVPARADVFRFPAVELHNPIGPPTGQLSLAGTDSAGYVYPTFPDDLMPRLMVLSPLTSFTAQVYSDDGSAVLDFLEAILRGSGERRVLPASPAHLPGGDNVIADFYLGVSAGATSGNSGSSAHGKNPGAYLQMGFSRESSVDQLLATLHTGTADTTAGVGALRAGVHSRPLAGSAGGQTGDGYTYRAPVPGAVLLVVFGLSMLGLSWRRFA